MRKIVALSALLALMVGCGELEFEDRFDFAEQRATDLAVIEAYLNEKGLGEPDTTESGARYVIVDEGEGDPINFGDIVGINYIGAATTGRVFDTSIPEVADTAFTNTVDFFLQPQFFTYTESGWTLREIFRITSQFSTVGNFAGYGLSEAMTEALVKMKTGGKLVVLLPSDQAFESTATSFFPAYSVLVYEIYPVEILR